MNDSSAKYKVWHDAFHTSQADPRFSYCYHIPSTIPVTSGPCPLLVVVHGSERRAMGYRDELIEFAETNRSAVLAPLFPVSPFGDGNGDGYKYLIERDLRYDELLFKMVGELEASSGLSFGRFMLFGFSGGGHFAHRFLYVHANRLSAVSIGAPGGITLIDDQKDWWLGTRNVKELFGVQVDVEEIRRIPIQMVIGSRDTSNFEYQTGSPYFSAEAPNLGRNRMERMATLKHNFAKYGISSEQVVVPDAAHEGFRMLPAVTSFFSKVLGRGQPTT